MAVKKEGKKKNYNYYEFFQEMSRQAGLAADHLHKTLINFDANALNDEVTAMHRIESAADAEKHDMMSHLVREFITPIEREDIVSLAHELDNVVDSIEEVLLRMYMYDVRTLREEALPFANMIVQCTTEMSRMLELFERFKKDSEELSQVIIQLNHLEEQGDRIYTEALRRLYTDGTPPIEIIAWDEIYNRFEKCCDNCEHVATCVEGIIMKNS